jgi:hypothetical protein
VLGPKDNALALDLKSHIEAIRRCRGDDGKSLQMAMDGDLDLAANLMWVRTVDSVKAVLVTAFFVASQTWMAGSQPSAGPAMTIESRSAVIPDSLSLYENLNRTEVGQARP